MKIIRSRTIHRRISGKIIESITIVRRHYFTDVILPDGKLRLTHPEYRERLALWRKQGFAEYPS